MSCLRHSQATECLTPRHAAEGSACLVAAVPVPGQLITAPSVKAVRPPSGSAPGATRTRQPVPPPSWHQPKCPAEMGSAPRPIDQS
jgi:hypothetical protein